MDLLGEESRVLLTGGTGSFGRAFTSHMLKNYPKIHILIFSRDELKQFEMREQFPHDNLDFMIGDVRDFERLSYASSGVDVVVHAAAMKQIPASEENPIEAIKTNIMGAENIARVAIQNKIKKVIGLSSDKAANPVNLYGATKLCSDKLLIAANRQAGPETLLSVVRYGNVLGSRGSVIPFFKSMAQQGYIPITDERMTRFWLSLQEGVALVINAFSSMEGGEIFIPKIPSFSVVDVAKVVAPGVPHRIVGIRAGEKLHEVMITEDDSFYTRDYGDYYKIFDSYLVKKNFYRDLGKEVSPYFCYRSDTNDWWHDEDSFRKVLKLNNLI